MKMKKLNTIIIALALLLTLSQCKKEDITDLEWVHITVKVNDGSKHTVYPDSAAYVFEKNDLLYVGNDGKYVGCLKYKDGTFSGNIPNTCSTEDYLHLYFMGGCGPDTTTLTYETDAFTVNISDQINDTLPVIAYGPTDKKFSTSSTTYNCFLYNQCALVKFQIENNVSVSNLCLLEMNNQVSVNLGSNSFSFSQDDTDTIKTGYKNNDGDFWAILLPQEAKTNVHVVHFGTTDTIGGTIADFPAISKNDYWIHSLSLNNIHAYTIEATANPDAGGTVAGGGTYYSAWSPSCTLTATPAEGYVFSSWTEGENVVSTDATYTFDVTGNRTLVANFSSLATPLTFEAKTAGATVTFTKASSLPSLSVDYSTDGTTWTPYTGPITLANVGDKVSFRGDNATYATDDSGNYSNFSCSNDCYVYGNIMSLINANDYPTVTILSGDYTFYGLFKGNSKIDCHPTKALTLPATTLAAYCYASMFQNCTNITTVPSTLLPATTLASFCYNSMFWKCSNLTAAPELPATTLAPLCYYGMFNGCTRLTSAPSLPATTFAVDIMTNAQQCYARMFQNCTSLTTAPALPSTTLAMQCYVSMFYGCTSLTTAPTMLPATTLTDQCYHQMFRGCTSLTTAPTLPATTLANQCYLYMFLGCTNLNKVTCLATNISASSCLSGWLSGVASSGTFYRSPDVTDDFWNGKYPSGWTINEAK